MVNSGSDERARDLANAAGVDAVGKLAADVGRMVARLKSELDTKELQRLRTPAARPRVRQTRG